MQEVLTYFENIPTAVRTLFLVSGLSFFLIVQLTGSNRYSANKFVVKNKIKIEIKKIFFIKIKLKS